MGLQKYSQTKRQARTIKITDMKTKKILPIIILSLIVFVGNILAADKIQSEKDTAKEQQIIPFLTFQKNDAEQAMNFYISLFPNSRIIEIKRWGKEGPGQEGAVMHATFELNGLKFMCSDSPPVHNWDFTPAIANYVECTDEAEIERLYSKLMEGGQVAMPLDNYGFSQKFAWVVDQFGVSWQLNLK